MNTGEARDRFSQLIRAAQEGETIVITRHGKPVAQIGPPLAVQPRRARLGGMKGRIRFAPGWDAPVDPDKFLDGEL